MQRRKKITLIMFVLVIVIGFCYAFYVWNKPARNVAKEAGIKITATAIFDSFTNNETGANALFLNKAIEVTGKVTEVKLNQAGETVGDLKSYDPVFGVNCTLKQYPGKMAKGDNIIFKGICTGYLSDVGNVEEMSANAIKLLSDKKLFNQFRENAFEQAKKFDIVNILPHYEKLYQQLVSNQAVLA